MLNALSSLWHPTQVLADILTLEENAHLFSSSSTSSPSEPLTTTSPSTVFPNQKWQYKSLPTLRPLTIAYVGDSANVLHDMLVSYPRLGHQLRVASPENAKYRAPGKVWDRVVQLGCEKDIWWGVDPKEAVKGADLVVTDTW